MWPTEVENFPKLVFLHQLFFFEGGWTSQLLGIWKWGPGAPEPTHCSLEPPLNPRDSLGLHALPLWKSGFQPPASAFPPPSYQEHWDHFSQTHSISFCAWPTGTA